MFLVPGMITASGWPRGSERLNVANTRQPFQGLEVGEVADARQPDHGDLDRVCRGPGLLVAQRDRVLGGYVQVQVGQDAQHGNAGELFQRLQAAAQNGRIAPEFVDHQALNEWPDVLGQELHRAEKAGEDATPLDIPYQDYGGMQVAGHVDIGEIPIEEVDLCRSACAFYYYVVVVLLQLLQRSVHHLLEPIDLSIVLLCRFVGHGLPRTMT